MNVDKPVLHFISGKLGSGKTTLAKKIAKEQHAAFISEDIWLEKLFPDAISNFQDYLLYSRRFREVIANHVVELLHLGVSVIFDFGGNVPQERSWVKSIFDRAQVAHVLHYIVASDELCRSQFKKRNRILPEGSKIITDQEFDAINRYFVPPEHNEGFHLQHHYRDKAE
jgi:predicted kinase